jgi:hypothetical protein
MITSINEILTEWAFRTKDGLPNPKSMAHQILLEGILKNYGWSVEARAELLNNLVEANADVVEPTLAKARKKADKGQTYSSPRSKKVYTRGKEEEEGEDSEKGNSVSGIEMPDLDLDMKGEKIGDILAQNKEIVYPLIQKTAGKVEELLKDGKKEEAKILAQTLVDKYQLTKPIYLQPGKANKAKIYVGSKHRYATGVKNEGSVGQKQIVDIFKKAGVKIPPKPGGISRTAVAPNEVHSKRKVGTVKTNMKDGKIVSKEVTIGERKFTIKADPEDPLSQKKLETLPDGEVEFCDINSAHTDEGRTECIVNASNNMIDMFNKIENELTDDFNLEIASNVKRGLKELQRLENEKNQAATTGGREELQKKFDQVCLDTMAATKVKNPNGVNEFTNMTAYMAETFEAMSLLNKGIETYIPSSGNFKTSDVLSLMGGGQIKSTVTSVDGRHADDGVLYIKGTSVKFAGGGASQMPNKNENSNYKDNDVDITVNGKERKGTLDVLNGLTDYYSQLFPESDEAQESISDDELKKMYDDNLNALYEYYPEFRDSKVLEDVMGRAKSAASGQLKRLNAEKMKKSEGIDSSQKRMEFYHFNQWVATMVYNHPERGMKTQSYSNSDYVVGKRGGKPYVKRVHSNGTDSVVWHGWDPDQGYMVNNKGKITPSNVYSSRMKHNNPAEHWIKMAQK